MICEEKDSDEYEFYFSIKYSNCACSINFFAKIDFTFNQLPPSQPPAMGSCLYVCLKTRII